MDDWLTVMFLVVLGHGFWMAMAWTDLVAGSAIRASMTSVFLCVLYWRIPNIQREGSPWVCLPAGLVCSGW